MYKKQMILQRIVCFAALAAGALVFLYSLGLMTDLYDSAFYYYAEDIANPMVAGTEVYYHMQGFNQNLTTAGIVLILLACAQFVAQNHARRKYYIANYITVAVTTIASIGVSVWGLINVMSYRAQYLLVDFETLATYSQLFGFGYTNSTFWFDVAWLVFGVLIAVAAVNVYNLILKRNLMISEKKLLENKEV
ncbi:MAG: hypothetical protein IKY14_05210 [Erysipelotrichaceae bacterium]|nr:hypothetical protein [Erysipelotrichaceae bacterium]